MSGLQLRLPAVRFLVPCSITNDGASEQEDVTERVHAMLSKELGPSAAQQLLLCSDVFDDGTAAGGGTSGVKRMCDEMGVSLLGKVPLDPALGLAAEQGRSVYTAAPGSSTAKPVCLAALNAVVKSIVQALKELPAADAMQQ
eukprot:365747-Chlamydomonas_euryale.AAC.40